MTKKILVAGCGKIGFNVAKKLAGSGHEVTALCRTPKATDVDFNYFPADLEKPEQLKPLPVNFDVVLIIVSPSDYSDEGYRAIYVDAVANLLEHFQQHNASPSLIYVSSTRVYGQHKGEWVDEQTKPVPLDSKGCILLEAEKQVQAFGAGENCVVRFSGIYDAQARFLLRALEQGKPIQRQPPAYTNRVHREDCIGVLVFLTEALLSGEKFDSLYLVSDHEPAPKWEVLSWLATLKGLPAPQPEHLSENANQGKRCSNQRIIDRGYRFSYPSYRDGYA